MWENASIAESSSGLYFIKTMKKDTVSYCYDHNYSRMLIKDERIISLLNHMQHVQKGSASFLLYTCKLTV